MPIRQGARGSHDECRLLTHVKVPRPVQHEACLLLYCLPRNEPHVGPRDGLVNGLSVGRIVLAPLDVGLQAAKSLL